MCFKLSDVPRQAAQNGVGAAVRSVRIGSIRRSGIPPSDAKRLNTTTSRIRGLTFDMSSGRRQAKPAGGRRSKWTSRQPIGDLVTLTSDLEDVSLGAGRDK